MKAVYVLKIKLFDSRGGKPKEEDCSTYVRFADIPFIPHKGQNIIIEDENLVVDDVTWNESKKILFINLCEWKLCEDPCVDKDGPCAPDWGYFSELQDKFQNDGWHEVADNLERTALIVIHNSI